MHAKCRTDLIAGTLARERDAADHVITLRVGLAIQAQLVLARNICRELRVRLSAAMVLVGHARRLRIVVGVWQSVQTLVHWPVELQSALRASKQAVEVA